ncbi:MAG: iron donor protein CyaY [Pseudomonadales bacterium]
MSNEFNDRIDSLFAHIEDAIDESELDADFENQGSVFTVTVEGCAPLILNRHSPTEQLWLAAQSGGYHMAFDNERQQWLCTRSGQSFEQLWNAACEAQYGTNIELTG